MLELLLPLLTGGAGGAIGGNLLGGLLGKAGGGVASRSLIGIVGGALATKFLGPTLGPMVGAAIGSGALDPMAIIANLATGAGGGGVLTIVLGLIQSMMGGKGR